MTYIPPALPITFIAAAAIWSIGFPWAYFTHIHFADNQERRLQVFVGITSLALMLACFTAYCEVIAQYRINVMVFPAEHAFSAQKVALIFCVALVTSLIALGMAEWKSSSIFIPSFAVFLPMAAAAAIIGLFSIYISTLGFCCETPLSVFAGFPLSMAHGVYGWNYSAYGLISQMQLIEILRQYGKGLYWEPDILAVFANLLFWAEVFFLLILPIQYLLTRRLPKLKP